MHSTAARVIPQIVPRESWEKELSQKHAIPSSTRAEPAKALVLFVELLGLASPLKVLDAGSGNGRNTVYLAQRGCEVTAVDFCDFALKETQKRVAEAGLTRKVSIVRHFLDDPAPFARESFDFVLDSYVSCHFLNEEICRNYLLDLARITKSGGHLLSIFFSNEDEYYSQLLKNSPDGSLVCDPANGIWKRLYTERQARTLFPAVLEPQYFMKFEFLDTVLGNPYRRVLFISVLTKRRG
jgi:SAM-dependent methyltransferase